VSLFSATRRWAELGRFTSGLRERRYELFMRECAVEPGDRILDVGAGDGGALARFNKTNPIVAVDLHPQKVEGTYLEAANVTASTADGTALPYEDKSFPVAFSNSVIEHVPKHLQQAFAGEIARVADRYYVQTPNRWFPIEPHYQMPLFHFLPLFARKWLNRHFTIGWRKKGHWEDVELLSGRDLRRLFPDARIERERVFGLTKSLMAVRGPRGG
jgi:SAM-dependent methyltransferase